MACDQKNYHVNENKTKNIVKIIKREMDYFETVKIREKKLGPVFEYLSTIQPTSVKSERAFSATGLLCTKIHSSLNAGTLEAFCLLRAHFEEYEL
jgi:hypothetical protein